jgi:hypothetical protein
MTMTDPHISATATRVEAPNRIPKYCCKDDPPELAVVAVVAAALVVDEAADGLVGEAETLELLPPIVWESVV